jgi:hypothetical protein
VRQQPRLASITEWALPSRVRSCKVGRTFGALALVVVTIQNISTLTAASMRLTDGTLGDPCNRHLAMPPAPRPKVVSAVCETYRWRRFLSLLKDQSYDVVSQRRAFVYANYLYRGWNDDRPQYQKLKTIEIAFLVEWRRAPGVAKTVDCTPVWTQPCIR